MILRLTKRFTFEMAHALPSYQGKCHNIHGHSYKLYVTIEGSPLQEEGASSNGMVLDFGAIKAIIEQHIVSPFDHALVLPRPNTTDPQPALNLGGYAAKLIWVDFQPTTENLLMHFASLLEGRFPDGTRLYSLKLYETESSSAEIIL